MPIYNFECNNCTYTTEYIALNFHDYPKQCPFCNCNNSFKKNINFSGSFSILNDYDLGKKQNFEAHYPHCKEPVGLYPKT